MDPSDKQRFERMAEDYDRMAPLLVPIYDLLQQEMIRQTRVGLLESPRVIDMGAGSGRLLERVLEASASATCWWVDSSEAFLSVARRRLARFEGRVRFIVSEMEATWENGIDGPVDTVCSMSAIHHLESREKRAVYQKAFTLLKSGGWFLNTDEMKGLDAQAYRASLHVWADYVDERLSSMPDELRGHAARWKQHFDRWKARNIDGFDLPKTKGDDMHDPFLDQAAWLREIGFVNVDLFAKYHLWCMLGGRRP